jgi:hypothetical protein
MTNSGRRSADADIATLPVVKPHSRFPGIGDGRVARALRL